MIMVWQLLENSKFSLNQSLIHEIVIDVGLRFELSFYKGYNSKF